MIRPTRRAVLLFAAVLPLPWIALSVRTALWPYAFHPAILFFICLAADAILARPLRRVQVSIDTPEAAYIGETLDAAITVRQDPPTIFDAALDLSGDTDSHLDPFAIQGRELLQIRPGRRGTLRFDLLWLRWRGPMRLIEGTRRFPI